MSAFASGVPVAWSTLLSRNDSLPRRLGFVAPPGSIDIHAPPWLTHEIAHLSHCLAIKFSETAEGNCRQDLGVTIEIWGSSR